MSKTWRREAFKQKTDRPKLRHIEEDEDTDPRLYNVIQRISEERDSRRLEKAVSDKA